MSKQNYFFETTFSEIKSKPLERKKPKEKVIKIIKKQPKKLKNQKEYKKLVKEYYEIEDKFNLICK